MSHELARQIIAKHGADRYPTSELQFMKLQEEIGELAATLLKNKPFEEVQKEYGDVGLALYALGNKLGLDLRSCMNAVVNNETRSFA